MSEVQAIATQHPCKRVEVWFEDEARLGQQGTLTRKWALCGSRPPAVRQTQYDYLYVLAAVCPKTGQTHGMLAPFLNTDVINVFLREMAKSIAEDAHVVLMLDQAGYHTSKALMVPSNITLMHLPPRSPELNPVENLWHYERAHCWSNREYQDYEALEDAGCEAWHQTCLDAELIKTVCRVDYLETTSREVKT